MNTDIWYYEYIITIWNDTDKKEEMRSGIVPGESMATAVKALEQYYGDELMDLHMLKAIVEAPVFEFEYAMEDTEFDFTVDRVV